VSGTDDMHLIGDKWGRIRNIDVCSEEAPTITWPYMLWVKPTSQSLRVRNRTDTAWVTIGGGNSDDMSALVWIGW
jgi:hypothetical protein